MKEDRLERICEMVRSLREEGPTMSVGAGGYTGAADSKGPVAGYDPVLGKVDRRNKKQKNYPKEYVQMFRDAKKGNRLKSVLK
jgi:acetoin utilization deacetylase AcuC-like enzyme